MAMAHRPILLGHTHGVNYHQYATTAGQMVDDAAMKMSEQLKKEMWDGRIPVKKKEAKKSIIDEFLETY